MHEIINTEERTVRGMPMVRWVCSCGKISRWLNTRYLASSIAQHARRQVRKMRA